jgi:ABC-2 type transport system permease protein
MMLQSPHTADLPGLNFHPPPVASFLRVVQVTTIKDIRLNLRYLPDLAGRFAEIAIRVLFFWIFASAISIRADVSPLGQAITGHDLVIYFQGALALFVFNGVALSAPVNAVSRDLYNGTLEYLFLSPSSRYAYFVGTVTASAIISLSVFVPVFSILVWASGTSLIDVMLVLGVCVMVLATIIAFGILIALTAILWRQVGFITSVLSILFEMLSGAYFPVSAFPRSLQYLSLLLPYTWGYDLIRYYSFGGRWKPMFPVPLEWAVLAAFAVAFAKISYELLKTAERLTKKRGLNII